MSKIIDIKGNETKSPSKPLYNYATFLRDKADILESILSEGEEGLRAAAEKIGVDASRFTISQEDCDRFLDAYEETPFAPLTYKGTDKGNRYTISLAWVGDGDAESQIENSEIRHLEVSSIKKIDKDNKVYLYEFSEDCWEYNGNSIPCKQVGESLKRGGAEGDIAHAFLACCNNFSDSLYVDIKHKYKPLIDLYEEFDVWLLPVFETSSRMENGKVFIEPEKLFLEPREPWHLAFRVGLENGEFVLFQYLVKRKFDPCDDVIGANREPRAVLYEKEIGRTQDIEVIKTIVYALVNRDEQVLTLPLSLTQLRDVRNNYFFDCDSLAVGSFDNRELTAIEARNLREYLAATKVRK